MLDFLGTWVAGGLGLGGLGLCGLGLCGLDLSVGSGLGPSPPSVHIALCLLCFLVSFSSRQSTSFVSNSRLQSPAECVSMLLQVPHDVFGGIALEETHHITLTLPQISPLYPQQK
jgi:hypothetical protein